MKPMAVPTVRPFVFVVGEPEKPRVVLRVDEIGRVFVHSRCEACGCDSERQTTNDAEIGAALREWIAAVKVANQVIAAQAMQAVGQA